MLCPRCRVRAVVTFGPPGTEEQCHECRDLDARAVRLGTRVRLVALGELAEDPERIVKEIREATATRVAAWRERRRQQQ
jgi:hypothetical protein